MIKYITLLLVIAISTHVGFFNFGNILFNSDWTHWNNIAVKDLLNSGWGTWISYFDFGSQNIQLSFNFFQFIWGIVGDYNFATKLTFLIPISIGSFLSPFFLIRYYTKNEFVSFLIALFYGLNSYFLVRQTAHLPIAFIISILPIILMFFDKFVKNNNKKDFLIFTILYFIGICYEIRIMYITTILLIIYFLFFGLVNLKSKTFWKYILVFIGLQILLNSFWLISTILSSGEAISGFANRGLFGDYLFNILYAINNFDSSWTGGIPNQDFIPQIIPYYFWFYPLLVFLSALFIKKQDELGKKLMMFGLTISILGIILTKQSAEPFVGLYQWLYNNFPGFNLFRDASKFYIITLLGYSIILGVFLDFLYKNHRRGFYFAGIIIILISSIIAKPLITQEIGTLWVPKIEPQEYKILNNYISNQTDIFKTLWIPTYSQWGHFDITKPKMSLINVIQGLHGDDGEYGVFMKTRYIQRNFHDYSSFIFEPINDKTLNVSGIRYLIVGLKDSQDDFFRFYGSTPEQYYQKLRGFPFLKELKIDGLSEVKIFENSGYLSTVFTSDDLITKDNINNLKYEKLESMQKNPSHYTSKVHLNGKTTVNFSQKKNKNWNLVVGDFRWYDYFIKKPFLVDNNAKSLDFINSWTLSKDEIINSVNNNYSSELTSEGYPKDLGDGKKDYKYYTLNPDGSIDVRMTLYFRPQSYFYLGLIISGTTLVLLLGYLGWSVVRKSSLPPPGLRGVSDKTGGFPLTKGDQ